MTDLFASAASWLGGQFKAHGSQTVTYRRGAQSVQLAAHPGRSDFDVLAQDGVATGDYARDFIVDAADLDFGAGPVQPAAGDRIERTAAGATHSFEVMSPGDEPVWRWADGYHRRRRIHTKEVSVA